MNSNGVTVSPTPGNLLDDFEEAYKKCIGPITQEDPFTCVDLAELQTNAEANSAHFLDLARSMQAFFLQKRFQLSAQKPELIMMEDVAELRGELAHKDELIEKHNKKLAEWQATINAMENRIGGSGNVNLPGSSSSQLPSTQLSTTDSPSHQNATPGPKARPGTTGMVGNRGGMMGQQGGMSNTSSYMSTVGHSYNAAGNMGANSQVNMQGMDSSSGGRGGNMSMGGGSSPHMMMGGGVHSPTSMMGGSQVASGYGRTGGVMGGYGTNSLSHQQQGTGALQGPLAYLEKTTTNIGMP